jgi:biopolymer transport protein ExbD
VTFPIGWLLSTLDPLSPACQQVRYKALRAATGYVDAIFLAFEFYPGVSRATSERPVFDLFFTCLTGDFRIVRRVVSYRRGGLAVRTPSDTRDEQPGARLWSGGRALPMRNKRNNSVASGVLVLERPDSNRGKFIMAMSTDRDDRKIVAEMNVTAMIDVMLVLLIIFMVVALALKLGVSVSLPTAKNPEIDMKLAEDKSAVLTIPDEGKYFLNNHAIRQEDIGGKVDDLLKTRPVQDRIVYVKAGKAVSYGTLVTAIDAIRGAGYERIGLVSRKDEAKPVGAKSQ